MTTTYTQSIERLILDNIVTTLEALGTVGAVYEGKFSPLEVDFAVTPPTFVAVNPVASLIVERVPQTLRRQLQLDLHVWVDAAPDQGGTVLDTLKADIEEALQYDDRRGGLAETTFLATQEFVYVIATERLRGVIMPYNCTFLTSLRSPRETVA